MSVVTEPTLFDPGPGRSPEPGLSVDAARTARNRFRLANGVHPATLRPLLPGDQGLSCGDCAHHHASDYHSRIYHKCDVHRLGESHSAASDIRVSWPACVLYAPEAEA